MAQKLLKAGGKRKVAAKKLVGEKPSGIVVVGNYKTRQLDWIGKKRSLALVPEGRLKRIYAIENAVKTSGALEVSLASAIKYVRAGRGAQIPCGMCVDACSWSRDYHKAILKSRADVDLMTALFLAAAEKVYVPEIDFVELQLPQIEHLRYNVKKEEIKKPTTQLGEVVKWLQKVTRETMRTGNATRKRKHDNICGRQFHNQVSNMIGFANGGETDSDDESGRIALSLIPSVDGWKVDDGIYVNRKRRIFGIVGANNQGTNLVDFAVGIVIGCRGARVYIINGKGRTEKQLGRIPKAFQPFIDEVTIKRFFNMAAGSESAYQDLCSAIEDVRRSRKTERRYRNAHD